MKTILYDSKGEKKGEVNLPSLFDTKVREDLVLKYFLIERISSRQPYSHDPRAGRKHVASGRISHRRHEWGGHYGKGISRVPRKTMWRRGTQFFWIAAEVSGTRGGRRVHGPVLNRRERKINQKEVNLAIQSAFASTAHKELVAKRYSSLSNTNITFPIVFESSLDKIKAKDLISSIKKILGDNLQIALKKKEVRSGKGKIRGRKYKSNAAVLLIKTKAENIKLKGIEVKSLNEVNITDLYPLGRLTIYTEKAITELTQGAKK